MIDVYYIKNQMKKNASAFSQSRGWTESLAFGKPLAILKLPFIYQGMKVVGMLSEQPLEVNGGVQ